MPWVTGLKSLFGVMLHSSFRIQPDQAFGRRLYAPSRRRQRALQGMPCILDANLRTVFQALQVLYRGNAIRELPRIKDALFVFSSLRIDEIGVDANCAMQPLNCIRF